MSDGYLSVNRANWDERAGVHAASELYAINRFQQDPTYRSGVVRFDEPRLGELDGLRGVHLQCHIGTDTLSLARLGAAMTGLDMSPRSLRIARELAASVGAPITYVESDVYGALDLLEAASFDFVYTGIGALCWLPSITRWAATVSGLLRPGGWLFIREGHPMLWALDSENGPLELKYPYFETVEPMVLDDPRTYVEGDHVIAASTTHNWNHGIAEIISALTGAGMTLAAFEEHDSVPWEALPGHMVHDPLFGEWRLTTAPERLAASYTLQAIRSASGGLEARATGRAQAPLQVRGQPRSATISSELPSGS